MPAEPASHSPVLHGTSNSHCAKTLYWREGSQQHEARHLDLWATCHGAQPQLCTLNKAALPIAAVCQEQLTVHTAMHKNLDVCTHWSTEHIAQVHTSPRGSALRTALPFCILPQMRHGIINLTRWR